jgi:hypothetical protein
VRKSDKQGKHGPTSWPFCSVGESNECLTQPQPPQQRDNKYNHNHHNHNHNHRGSRQAQAAANKLAPDFS